MTTEAGRTAQTAQQAAITGQTATTATTSLTEDQILQGLNPAELAETASWAARNPLTSSFLGGAATVAKMTGSAILSGYIGSQFQEDPRVSPSGKDYEGASRFNPLQIYAAEEGIDYGDMDKYFTFNNIGDTSNMPLFQQQTIGIT